MIRPVRKLVHVYERTIPFFKVAFSKRGLPSPEGRQLILGKARRVLLSSIPPLAAFLRRYYKLEGGCVSCGASCKLLFQCPHWDEKTHLCTVYEDRPNICRSFPITPGDLKDRDLIRKDMPCGFQIKPK